MSDRVKLKSLYLSGFKSFAWSPLLDRAQDRASVGSQDGRDFHGKRVPLGDTTVFLGANGAGKSNIISLFKMISDLATGQLQRYVATHGRASSLLHFGPKVTTEVHVEIELRRDPHTTTYRCILSDAAPDTLVFTREGLDCQRDGEHIARRQDFGTGHQESLLPHYSSMHHVGRRDAEEALFFLQRCKAFQFHDTSETSSIRKACYLDDDKHLRHDGGNLAAILLRLKADHADHYNLIRRAVGRACPQFDDFDLSPSERERDLFLNWRAKNRPDHLFGPHQLSDGTLRFMALATLLLQPANQKPLTILIDEPELGLHPTAIALLASMVKQASVGSQIVMTTQSPTLVDHFEPKDLRPMAHQGGSSSFLDFEPRDLDAWLQDYSLGELWQKNMFRGGPEHG